MKRDRELAESIVTGVIAGMVTAVAAATAVGFWLSFTGLHAFAVRAGMAGPEAWAFPSSIDLFIAAGEAGVTISALRRRRDPLAWCYLAAGFAASVTGNVLHVASPLSWERYAVAAVPPMAAMLALAALLRHVYRLALDAHLRAPVAQPETVPVTVPETGPALVDETPALVNHETPARSAVTQQPAAERDTGDTSPRGTVRRLVAADPDVPVRRLAAVAGVSPSTAARWKKAERQDGTMAGVSVNGNGASHA